MNNSSTITLERFDIIICGAGCAGLSFAYHLSKSIWAKKKILLLDADSKQSNDRTWCFWSKEIPAYACANSVQWDRLSFLGKNFEKTANINPYKYYQITGLDFYNEIKTHLKHFPNIEFRQESVQNIQDNQEGATVYTENAKYQTSWIFNSIPQFSSAFPLAEDSVKQYFKGFFIKTSEAAFQEQTLRLMDFSYQKSANNPITFFYVLPYNAHEALVECTVFATQKQDPETYQDDIRAYIKEKLAIQDFEITAEEKGMIPMSDAKMPFKSSPRIFQIGTAGGMTKASTGYTFNNIQKFCTYFFQNWRQDFENPPSKYQSKQKRFGFYDNLLLHIIKHYPEQFQRLMETLFEKNEFKRILKFLDEKSNLWDEAQLFTTLPWKPFLNAIYEQYFPISAPNKQSTHWHHIDLGATADK